MFNLLLLFTFLVDHSLIFDNYVRICHICAYNEYKVGNNSTVTKQSISLEAATTKPMTNRTICVIARVEMF